MPEKYTGLGISLLFPETWKLDDDAESEAVTVESPEGAFLTVTKLPGQENVSEHVEQAIQTMESEYDEVEQEPLAKRLADRELTGVTQRFVYLDLIVTSCLLTVQGNTGTYLIQMQAEDRDMDQLEQVFDAILTSLCQSLAEELR